MSIYPSSEDVGRDQQVVCQRGQQVPIPTKRWNRFKKKWNRKGIVEVDTDHHRHDMLNCVRQGIQEIILNNPHYRKEKLQSADYTDVYEKIIVSPSGKTFHFTSHASAVFVMIRNAIGLSEEDYVKSLAPPTLPYLEFISNSKSGADFYISNDKCYFMKTDKSYYMNVFQSFLGDYLRHFQMYPHSLIVKILGLYSIKVPQKKKLDFLVMQSIFYPDSRIEYRFDIKGCFAGRHQKPPNIGSNIVTVLKDQNFEDENIELGATQKDWFLKQIELDAEFMAELGVQDYSLLVGKQVLADDEKKDHFADVVIGITKTLKLGHSHESSFEGDVAIADKLQNPKNDNSLESYQICHVKDNEQEGLEWSIDVESSSTPRKSIQHTLSFYKPNINAHNLRLLPNSRNGIHIIDGPTQRYFLGVIDFFTLYECRQRSGRFLKNIKYCCGDHSTVPPDQYAQRFVKFIREHTT